MRNFHAMLAAAALLSSSAFAADTNASANSSLAPGKPAGLRTAQEEDNTIFFIIGLGAIGAGIAILASDNGNGSSTPSTPSTQ